MVHFQYSSSQHTAVGSKQQGHQKHIQKKNQQPQQLFWYVHHKHKTQTGCAPLPQQKPIYLRNGRHLELWDIQGVKIIYLRP